MVDIHPVGDRAERPLVDHPVSTQRARLIAAPHHHRSIAMSIERPLRRSPALIFSENFAKNEKRRRQRRFHFFLPRTLRNLGFAFFAAGDALRVEAARIAPARLLLIPCRCAICDWAALKPIPLRDFAICSS